MTRVADDNLAVIRATWERYHAEGLPGITTYAAQDAEWRPHSAGGRVFRSTPEYREYLAGAAQDGVRVESSLLGMWAHADLVVTRGRIRVVRRGTVVEDTRMYWLHRLRDGLIVFTESSPDLGRLLEDAGHPDDALAAEAMTALRRPLAG